MALGYGDDYGYKYSYTWWEESGSTAVSLSTTSTTQVTALESGNTATTGLPSATTDARVSASGATLVSGSLEANVSYSSATTAFEDGRTKATANIAGIETATATETGTIQPTTTIDVDTETLVSVAPSLVGSASVSGTETATAVETGSTSATALPAGSPTYRAFLKGNSIIETQASLSGTETAIAEESGNTSVNATFGLDLLPDSVETDPVDIVVDLLRNIPAQLWTHGEPNVLYWWDRAQSERGPGDGQPAEFYVYRETTQDHERFSADADNVIEEGSITIYVYSLYEDETQQYLRDLIEVLEEYMSDNYRRINLHNLEGEESNDYRPEHITQNTDYYVESHTVGYRDYRSSGV